MNLDFGASTVNHVFASWGRIVLVVWRGRTEVEALKQGLPWFQEMVRRSPGPLLLLTIIEEKAKLPDLDARVALAHFMAQAQGNVERSAVVFEGDGFRATSIRAVVSGILLFSRPAYPHRVFSTVGAAARFLVGGRGGQPAPHLVIRATREARRKAVPYPSWLPVDHSLQPEAHR